MEESLHFCLITTFYPPYSFGGDGMFVRRLAHALGDRGHRVDVIHDEDAYGTLGGKVEGSPTSGHPRVTVHPIRSWAGALSTLATQQTGRPLFTLRAIQRVLARAPDVIHYHNVSLVGGPRVLEMGRGLKLYTTHEYWLVCPTHIMFRFDREPCEEPRCLACVLAHRRPPQLWRSTGLLDRAVASIDTFISPSRFGIELHRRMGFEAPMIHLPNFATAADEDMVAAGDDEEGSPTPYFLYVGRLERLKGLQTVLPLFTDRPTRRLRIAGSGSYEPALRRIAADCGNIEFLGYVSGPRLQKLYREATALIVPSLCYELSPLVIPEAFRWGTPALARNRGCLPEMVEHGGATYDDDQELEHWMLRLINEPSLRASMSEEARSAYERVWSLDVHMGRYLNVVRDRLAAGRASLSSSASTPGGRPPQRPEGASG